MFLTKVIGFVFFVMLCVLSVMILNLGKSIYDQQANFYQPIDYLENSQENIDPWRWRKPNIKLRIPYDGKSHLGIKNAVGVSSFIFPEEIRISHFIAHLAGVFLIGNTIFMFLHSCQTETITEILSFDRLLVYLLLLSLGWLCLQSSNLVLQIDLYPNCIGIVIKYALFWRRTIIYKRDHSLTVTGKLQSFWTMENGQFLPDYKITIGHSLLGYFHVTTTFNLHCTQTTGSWVVGALKHWNSII